MITDMGRGPRCPTIEDGLGAVEKLFRDKRLEVALAFKP